MCHRLLAGATVAILAVGVTPLAAQLNYTESSAGLETPTMEAGPTELEFGDVDGDGHVDLVMIGDHGSPFIGSGEHGVTVWFGDGAGNWSVYQNGDFGYGGVALGDVNNDGWMDVGYGMHHDYSGTDFGNQLLEVALGDGSGQDWTPWDDGLATAGESWGMFGTDFADVDNDGDLDLGSISFGSGAGLHIYLNNGDGTWTHSYGFTGGNSTLIFQFGDVNGDGNADFAAGHGTGTVWFGDGSGGFTQEDGNLPSSSYGLRGISLGDVNDDGRDDLALINAGSGLDVWTWVGPGAWQEISGTLPATGSFDLAQIADMNLDGHGDVVAFTEGEPGQLVVYTGDGQGNWTLSTTVLTPDCCDYAALRAGADADHNGYPDVVLISEEDCSFWVGGTNRPRFYKESSTPTSTWIYPRFPRGGETLVAGSMRFVDWTAAAVGPAGGMVRVELSLAGPGGPWIPVAEDLPNNGRFQWLLPMYMPTSPWCHFRYWIGAATATTPEPFTISGIIRLADYDDDGDVDLADAERFADCLYGPDVGLAGSACPTFDFDWDDDVDLDDCAAMQRVFTGS